MITDAKVFVSNFVIRLPSFTVIRLLQSPDELLYVNILNEILRFDYFFFRFNDNELTYGFVIEDNANGYAQ